VVIPFEVEEGAMLVPASYKDHQLTFIFDTGLSDYNVLTSEKAAALGLSADNTVDVKAAGQEGVKASLANVQGFVLGSESMAEQLFAIVPIRSDVVARRDKPAVAGLLGQALLRGNVMCANNRTRQLTFERKQDFTPSSTRIPLSSAGGLPTLSVSVDGVSATLMLDTGYNGGITLFPEVVDRHRLRERYPERSIGQMSGAVGSNFRVERTRARTIKVHDVPFHDVDLTFSPRGQLPSSRIDGLIGLQVLLATEGFCIDLDRGAFYFEQGVPQTKGATPFRS